MSNFRLTWKEKSLSSSCAPQSHGTTVTGNSLKEVKQKLEGQLSRNGRSFFGMKAEKLK